MSKRKEFNLEDYEMDESGTYAVLRNRTPSEIEEGRERFFKVINDIANLGRRVREYKRIIWAEANNIILPESIKISPPPEPANKYGWNDTFVSVWERDNGCCSLCSRTLGPKGSLLVRKPSAPAAILDNGERKIAPKSIKEFWELLPPEHWMIICKDCWPLNDALLAIEVYSQYSYQKIFDLLKKRLAREKREEKEARYELGL